MSAIEIAVGMPGDWCKICELREFFKSGNVAPVLRDVPVSARSPTHQQVIFHLVFFDGMSEIPSAMHRNQTDRIVRTNDMPSPFFRSSHRVLGNILALILFWSLHARAQESRDYSAVDAYALSIQKSEASSVEHLATVLARGANNDREKARVIYRWVTKNISYDTHAFFTGDFGDMSANNVLKTMKGVCDGYAQLYTALAKAMGLEAIRIVGNSKGYGYEVGSPIEDPPNHAWNAVRLDGSWRLVDCTWGAGYIDEKKEYVERFSDYYFLTPADQFIYDHFPQNPEQQFLSPPVSKEYYQNLATLQPLAFRYGLKLKTYRQGIIRASKRLDVVLEVPENVMLLLQLLQNGVSADPSLTHVYRNGAEATLTAVFPEAGKYLLRLFVKQREDRGTKYEKALDYLVDVDEPMTRAVSFPVQYEAFAAYDLTLKSPAEQETRVERNVTLHLTSAPDVKIIASLQRDGTKLDESSTFVQSEDGDHTIRAIFPQPGDYSLTVYAKRAAEHGNYNAVYSYHFTSVSMKDQDAAFPIVYEQYRDYRVRLIAPMAGRLEAGQSHDFKIVVPGADDVALVSGGKWTHLQKDGDNFGGKAFVGPDKAELFARFPGNTQFIGLVRFQGVRR